MSMSSIPLLPIRPWLAVWHADPFRRAVLRAATGALPGLVVGVFMRRPDLLIGADRDAGATIAGPAPGGDDDPAGIEGIGGSGGVTALVLREGWLLRQDDH